MTRGITEDTTEQDDVQYRRVHEEENKATNIKEGQPQETHMKKKGGTQESNE